MPVYSGQTSGMISQQNQMFAGYGSYAGTFSPGAPPGMMNYGEPNSQQGPYGGAYPTFPTAQYEAGQHVLGGIHAALPTAIGAATFAGAFLPGFVGTSIGRLDPFQAALSGFGRASGVSRGIAGMGVMDSIGTMGANIGRIGAGGVGNVFRAGLTGIGGAAAASFLPLAGLAAVQHATGQMAEGAQFTGQVQRTLGQNFRFLNPQSQTGYGFSREQGAEIADTIRTMGNKDIMSSPQEMLRIMNQSIQGGLFRPVQDAKAFQEKFKEVVAAVKEIAKTFNTTLEGAMPFLQEGRRMGFWTPADIQRMAGSTLGTAKITGLSVAQVQQMQQQGADMARQVGAVGATGARGMTGSLGLVGGAIRGGVLSEQALSDMTGGLTGSDAIQAFAGQLQASATRFSASGTGRWLLAGLAGKDMRHLDKGKLAMLASGQISAGDLRGMAEKNVQGRGAAFRMGEEEMRGDLLEMGFEGQAGFLKGLVGDRLYGKSDMDKYVTRRLIQRFTGGTSKEADAKAEMLRNMEQTLRENKQNSEALFDQKARDQKELMDHSYEGLKRKVTLWWKSNIDDPLQEVGSKLSEDIGDTVESFSDKFWGRSPRALRNMGITSGMARAMRAGAFGDLKTERNTFASKQEMIDLFGKPQSGAVQERLLSTPGGRDSAKGYALLDATSGSLSAERAKALGYSSQDAASKGLATISEAWGTPGIIDALEASKSESAFSRGGDVVAAMSASKYVSAEAKKQFLGITAAQQEARVIASASLNIRKRGRLQTSEEAERVRKSVGLGSGQDDNTTEQKINERWDTALNKLGGDYVTQSPEERGYGLKGIIWGLKGNVRGVFEQLNDFGFGNNTLGNDVLLGSFVRAGTKVGTSNPKADVHKLMTSEDGEQFKGILGKLGRGDVEEASVEAAKLASKYYGKEGEEGKHKILNDIAHKENIEAYTELGKMQQARSTLQRDDTFQKRLGQVKSSLESHGDLAGVMEGLTGAGLGGLADLIGKGNVGQSAPDIVNAAMAAVEGVTDPKQLARAAALLKESGAVGAGFIEQAIGGRAHKLSISKSLKGHRGISATDLDYVGKSLLGREFTPDELKKSLGSKGGEYIKHFVAGEISTKHIDAQQGKILEEFLQGRRHGDGGVYSAVDKITKAHMVGALGGGAEGARTLAGRGTLPGIHTTLLDILSAVKSDKKEPPQGTNAANGFDPAPKKDFSPLKPE